MNKDTQFVKAGETPDPVTGSLTTPIYQTLSYLHPIGDKYRYSRESNPTVVTLSNKIAQIEDFEAGSCYSSGMAAITTLLLALLKPGSTLVLQKDVFGRTVRFAKEFLSKWGVNVIMPLGNERLLEVVSKGCDMVFVESLTNPVLRVTDIPSLAKEANRVGAYLVVDNTVATPFNLRPAKHGAHAVVHSASKFLSGHNDVVAGLLAGKKEVVEKAEELRKTMGAVLDAHAAYLVIRGIKSLPSRMSTINQNAMKIAKFLEKHPKVERVNYPGLESHPDYALAKTLLNGYGGLMSFVLKSNDSHAPERFMSSLKLVYPANTLGAADTIISHPATMSHRNLSEREREEIGVSWSLLRLSVGLEDPEDIIQDLEQAFSSI